MPLHIPLLIIQCSCPNLKQPHTHPRTHLRQLNRLEPSLDKDVMSDLNSILDVFERDNTVSDLGCGFPRWEKVFQDLYAAFS